MHKKPWPKILDHYTPPVKYTSDKRDALQIATHLELPEEANVVFFQEEKGSDLYIRAKIKMERKLFLAWLKSFHRDEKTPV
jgi:hypothetical protein